MSRSRHPAPPAEQRGEDQAPECADRRRRRLSIPPMHTRRRRGDRPGGGGERAELPLPHQAPDADAPVLQSWKTRARRHSYRLPERDRRSIRGRGGGGPCGDSRRRGGRGSRTSLFRLLLFLLPLLRFCRAVDGTPPPLSRADRAANERKDGNGSSYRRSKNRPSYALPPPQTGCPLPLSSQSRPCSTTQTWARHARFRRSWLPEDPH